MSASKGHTYRQAGFTLIELLVICAIIVVITGLILIDNNKFGGEVILENLAYDVALSVRQAQEYGIAVERFGTGQFNTGYGMYFSLSSPSTYILFADEDGTGIYDGNASPSEIVDTEDLTQGYVVSGLCTIPEGSASCTQDTEIDIVFERPEPDAYISAGTSGGSPLSCIATAGNCQYEAQITLTSPKGDTRTVLIDQTGQISVAQQ